MNNEPEDTEEEPLTPEEQAQFDATMREHELAWEAEATRTYGPPDVRASKNRRYTARLTRKYSEPTIRGILKALSTLDDPTCCENLRNHDLDSAPLDTIIQPFELLGLHFRVVAASDQQITVDIGEAYGTVGSGGQFQLERTGSHTFRINSILSRWIA